ncbi:MAG: hypothetical protein HYU66_26515, partial [Armatimonadetes bacterium]|nr:hypothetical protein [Armatimonadota bacterium]
TAATPRQVLGRFRNSRDEIVAILTHKARECGEQIRFVEDFDNYDENAGINFAKLMRRHF